MVTDIHSFYYCGVVNTPVHVDSKGKVYTEYVFVLVTWISTELIKLPGRLSNMLLVACTVLGM